MPLSRNEVQSLVEKRPKKDQLEKAINHEGRLRFHVETILIKRELGKPYTDFINWLGSEKPVILEKGKVDRIDELIQMPIPTVELSESIFSRLHRVFNSQDSYRYYKFNNDKLESDWSNYRDCDFWNTKGFEALQTAINSIWVVDFKDPSDRVNPINKLIDISSVIDISVDDNNNCEYLIFRDGDMIYLYDELQITVYKEVNGQISVDPIYTMAH